MAFPAVTLILAKLIRPDSTSTGPKLKPYECGIASEGHSRGRYSVRFYIIAMLFVVFDVETMLLFPWAILYRSWVMAHMGLFALVSVFVYLGCLLVGCVCMFNMGVL